ncbi:hypothetical protein F2Q68_00008573 [Brassica cretica]|uniref:Arabidopsis retrotransposon Orf1 C-terminal domain-containing protein n=1 Tax=Brassica cretica TaxID=69181 RepID=A0A8S9KQY2_BRACR|nr:hypothetical protein F2Q68_00008573 [Brassica cretica]
MGMESLLGMSYGVHKEVSCQFMSTFAVRYHCEAHKTEGFWRITFQINGKPIRSAIVDDIWGEISGQSRTAGEDKSTDISNPGVRYAHKVLTHTFYSRREPGRANDDELKLLALGLLPILEEGTLLHTDPEDFEDMGLVGLLMKRFEYYLDWAWTTPNEKPTFFIGSLITPILEALGIDLGPRDHAPASIDLAYLKKTHFLTGQSGDRYGFSFWSRDQEPEQLQIFLPCERLTTLSDPQHVAFTPAAHELIPTDFGALESITKPRKKKTRASSSRAARPSDADDEGPITPAPVYGTERYHFRPYGGVTTNVALRQALSQNAKLLRWKKMQNSTIYKLKNSVKTLKRQMKKVTALLSQVSIGSGCQRDDVMAGAGSSTLPYPVYYGPPRSPEYQLRPREWEQAQSLVPHHLPKTIETLPYQVPEATINCYTDGSWRADQKHAGLRWVFIDGSGTTINKGSRFESGSEFSNLGTPFVLRQRVEEEGGLNHYIWGASEGFLNLVLVLIHSPRLLSVASQSISLPSVLSSSWYCVQSSVETVLNWTGAAFGFSLWFSEEAMGGVGGLLHWNSSLIFYSVAPVGGLTIPAPYPTRVWSWCVGSQIFYASLWALWIGQLRMVVPLNVCVLFHSLEFRPPTEERSGG